MPLVSNEYNSSIDNSPIAGLNSTSPQNNTSRDDVNDSCDGVATTTDRVDFSQTHLNESWFTQYICEKYLNATQIDLSHNKISYLENFIFAKFESIRHVNISFNQIEKIDEYAFCIIHVGNDIQFIPGEIEEIDLSNNKLNYFPTKSIIQLGNLVGLNLSRNNIEKFDIMEDMVTQNDTVRNQKFLSLKYLDLSHNKISYINSNFERMKSIIEIDLSFNLILNIDWTLNVKLNSFQSSPPNGIVFVLLNNSIGKCSVPQGQIILTNETGVYKIKGTDNSSRINWIAHLDPKCLDIGQRSEQPQIDIDLIKRIFFIFSFIICSTFCLSICTLTCYLNSGQPR